MDFKGWFRLGDRTRCDPFTVTDNFSRFLLCCTAMELQKSENVWKSLSMTFKEFGLPAAIRVDSAQPWWAPKGELGLTKLSAKILRLGVALERIAPAKPQENGRHERFHLTLQNEATRPPARTLRGQQRKFDIFSRRYNEVRPHEALGQRPPNTAYKASPRAFPSKLPEPIYAAGFDVNRIKAAGTVRFSGKTYFVSTALVGESVGVYEIEDGCSEVWFCSELLGHIHTAHPELGLLRRPKPLPVSSV